MPTSDDADSDEYEYAGKRLHESIPDPAVDRYPFITANGLQQCPYCGTTHHPPVEPIVTAAGERYSQPLDTDPGTPWYCLDCWQDRQDEYRTDENRALTEFDSSR